ncbi:mitochondrial ribosomal protein L33 [Megachile rotundata]|uniref:mitochondrial ribosomal protein L33 n=1 Tax=Megachile rotundata TaxID=143995 RepID=UPI000258DB05|nr:PREDICTED: 39S ribosomal protein L33, mitochondrial [Megachile rotundata]
MFLTNVLCKKAKSKLILVAAKSIATGHVRNVIRERTGDKVEKAFYDPFVGARAIYKEIRKIKSL